MGSEGRSWWTHRARGRPPTSPTSPPPSPAPRPPPSPPSSSPTGTRTSSRFPALSTLTPVARSLRDHVGCVSDVLALCPEPVPVHKFPREADAGDGGLVYEPLTDGQILATQGATLRSHLPSYSAS